MPYFIMKQSTTNKHLWLIVKQFIYANEFGASREKLEPMRNCFQSHMHEYRCNNVHVMFMTQWMTSLGHVTPQALRMLRHLVSSSSAPSSSAPSSYDTHVVFITMIQRLMAKYHSQIILQHVVISVSYSTFAMISVLSIHTAWVSYQLMYHTAWISQQ